MEQLQSLALNATTLFNNKEYEKSYQLFNELKNKTQSTNREVLMNLSIADYYQNKCSNPNKLIEELTKINQLPSSTSTTSTTPTESLSPAPTSPKEGSNNDSQTATSTPTAEQQHTTSSSSSNSSLDLDNDQALVIYNQAVLYNSMKQYGQAQSALETLYQNILFLDDYVAIRICFLMVNVNITLQLYDKAYSVLSYLEQNFSHLYYNKENNEEQRTTKDNSTASESTNSNTSSTSGNTTESDDSNSHTWSNTLMSPIEFRFMIHFYKSKLYLLSNNYFNLAKDEINHAITRATKINYRLLPSCYLLKSNYYHLCSNTTKTIQFLQQSTSNSSTSLSTSSSSTNIPTTTSTSSTTSSTSSATATTDDTSTMINPLSFGIDLQIEDITPQIFYNDLGCLHFNLHRYTPSIFYLTKALQEDTTQQQTTTSPTTPPSNSNTTAATATGCTASSQLDRRTEIFYNTGILLLLTGRPELAFQCLQEACLVLHNNPLVWLRLAECCILAHTQKSKEELTPQSMSLIGSPENTRRILLPTTSGLHQGLQIEDSDVQSTLGSSEESNESSRIGTLSLEFAAKCLRNAHYLHSKSIKNNFKLNNNNRNIQQQQNSNGNTNSKSATNSPTLISTTTSSSSTTGNPSATTNLTSFQLQQQQPTVSDLYHSNSTELMMNILTSMAYISLCTANPVVALTSSKELLTLCEENKSHPNIEKFQYYGHMYASEACVIMNCPDQAIGYLSPNFVDSIKDTSFQSKLHSNPIVDSVNPTDYRISFYINLTIAYLLKDDFENANQCITTLLKEKPQQQTNNNNINTNNTKISLLKVYVEIRKGNIENALAILSIERPLPILQE